MSSNISFADFGEIWIFLTYWIGLNCRTIVVNLMIWFIVDFLVHATEYISEAQVFAIHEGSLVSEKYVLLRSMDTKPVIRAYYYTVEPLTFRVGK